MKDIDDQIKKALRAEDARVYEEFEVEPSVFDTLMETMRGRHRWLNILGAFWTLVFLVLAVLSAVQFFGAAETRDLILWASCCVICFSAVSMFKIWYFMEMQKVALTREIKRLELQIARLAGRMPQ